MKFIKESYLKEEFGESEELNTFVAQLQRRFNPYYVVNLKLNGRESNRYFAYEEAGRKYYDSLMKETKKDSEYYDGAIITFTKIDLEPQEEELDYVMVDNEEEVNESFDSNQGLKNRYSLAKIAQIPVNNIFMINNKDIFEITDLDENTKSKVYNNLKMNKAISNLTVSHKPDFKHMNFVTNQAKEKYTIRGTIN